MKRNKSITFKTGRFVLLIILLIFCLYLYMLFSHDCHTHSGIAIAFTVEQLSRSYSINNCFLKRGKFLSFFSRRLSKRLKSLMKERSMNIYYLPEGFDLGDKHKWQIIITSKNPGFHKIRIVQHKEEGGIGYDASVSYRCVTEYVKDNKKIPPNIEKYKFLYLE